MRAYHKLALQTLLLSSCLMAPAFAFAQANEATVEEVVVTGQRASDRASLLRKRDATSSVEVISANDVGKLPDQNVAQALSRLPGLSTSTDKGEGRYIIIRGIEPNLANVTINNQTASAPEPESRNVKLDDIPSALIGSVTVIKSLTPDLDANAIAGQVDINTLSAFDRRKLILNGRVIGGTYSATDRRAIEGDVSAGGLFGADRQFGVVLALNYSKRPSYSEDILSGGRQTVSGVDLPLELDQRIYDPAYRTRSGAVANFDWRPNDDTKLYARIMYSKFDDNEQRNRFRFFFPGAAGSYTGLTADGGTITSTTGRRLVRRRNEITDTTTLALGGDFNVGPGTLTVQGTHALSTKEDPIRSEFEYRSANPAAPAAPVGGTFTGPSGLLDSVTPNATALDAANYRLRSYKSTTRHAEEDLNQLRVDYKLPMDDWSEGSYVKFGAKYLERDRFTDANGATFTYAGPVRTLVNDTSVTAPSTYEGRYGFGPMIDNSLALAFFQANPGLFTTSASDMNIESLGADYGVTESVIAAYVMASVNVGKLTIIPGVRMEKTEGDTRAIAVTPTSTVNDTYNRFGTYEYTDYFPSVNLKYQITDNLLARGALTTAIGRPNFIDLAPTVSVDAGSSTIAIGNPNLQPQEAVNIDASLEYYFPGEGGISVGVFHKNIKNPIFTSSRPGQTGTFGGVAVTNFTVNSTQNGTVAEVTGIEFNAQKPFTFLPSPFDGLGANLNVTILDGEMQVPGRVGTTPLPQQSDKLASAQVYYEKYGFSARLAYTYRSEYIDVLGSSALTDIYFDELSSLSAKVAYKVTRQVEVFAEANNMTDETDYYYYGTPDRFAEAETYGRSYRFGISFTY